VRLLAIDQGNTRTKLGLFQDGELRQTAAFATDKTASAADLEQAVFVAGGFPRDAQLGLCTVTPEMLPAWEALAARIDRALITLTGCSITPLRNEYATPGTLGPDRLLAAVAAVDAAGAPVIPISLGTATVVDAVSAEGAYLGGMIAPGIGVSAQYLSAAASALYPVPWQAPDRAIGRTTGQSLAGGWFFHSLGGLREMIRVTRTELGSEAPLVITGGWAAKLAPHLDNVALVDDFLVLHGIAITLTK